jgi:LmbE family N-acetylglucosaminyl deacetylase
MKLRNPGASIFVPDGLPAEAALARVTHLGIGAHPDDLEFMALHGILAHFKNPGHWFGGIVICHGGAEQRDARRAEQIEAARIGQYAAVVMLDYPSETARRTEARDIAADLDTLFQAMRPETVYLHNPADKHPTHIGACRHALSALRGMPRDRRPAKAYGCEVWRGLDWLPDEDKVVLNVSDGAELGARLVAVFASQNSGKRYDLAVPGRCHANATFLDAHKPDQVEQAVYAMDLSKLVHATRADLHDFTSHIVKRFRNSVLKPL